MEGGIYGCGARWEAWLPPGIRRFRARRELWSRRWDIVALTPEGRRALSRSHRTLCCRLLLLPGESPAERLPRLRIGCAVSYGLSPRDSLTFSSLEQPALCVQRALTRPDGVTIEPQEIPLPELPPPVERFLPFLGLWLLCGRG